MPTDPHSTRKPVQGKPAHKKGHTAQGNPARGAQHQAHGADKTKSKSAAKSSDYRSDHKSDYRSEKKPRRDGDSHAAADLRVQREKRAQYAESRPAKKLADDTYEQRYAAPRKKKKKFKFKRFFKKLGKQIAAFSTKLVQIEELPPEEMARDAAMGRNDLGLGKKDNSSSAQQVLKKVKKGLLKALRVVARGIYLGIRRSYQYLSKLPPRALLIGSSALGFVLITTIVLAIALPGKDSKAESADQLAAFTALQSEPTAIDSANADATQTSDTTQQDGISDSTEDATLPVDTESTTTDATQPLTFTGEIAAGTDDEIISTVQTRLMDLGYMDSDEPTQHFGPLTQSALKAFQRHNGLGDDGILGQETYAALMNTESKVYVMQLGDSGPDVEGVQQRLYELGYLDNKANIQGNFGEKTEEAAKAFQKKNHLTADGKVGSKTLEMLYGEDVVGNAYKLGDENAVIKDCQTALKRLGYVTFKPDGVMGKATVSAIKAFQQANGLTRDGQLGPVTRDMILSGEAQEMVMQLGDYGTDVKNMQTRLAKLNYLSSANATGYFGEITEDAVKAFQKRAGLSADGKVGGVTLTMMNSSSAKKAASAPSTKKENKTSGSSGSSSSSSGSSSSGSSTSSASDKTGVEKLVALAESKIGCKYVRGAKGSNTFDCSGFVYWCLKNAGVNTSYMTSIAWRSTSRFSRVSGMGSIERGDILVFSGSTASDGHVGIYLGGGKMIDASSSEGQVRQSSSVLSSGGYWSSHFICAYRVF